MTLGPEDVKTIFREEIAREWRAADRIHEAQARALEAQATAISAVSSTVTQVGARVDQVAGDVSEMKRNMAEVHRAVLYLEHEGQNGGIRARLVTKVPRWVKVVAVAVGIAAAVYQQIAS